MKASQYNFFTMKNKPHNSEIPSHQLMLRAGLIRQISSGIYVWLPTGIRVLNNIKKIIKKEMNKIGGIEIYMPAIQPYKLWNISGRWNTYGKELFKIFDRKNNQFVLGPTHEELITQIIKNEIHSYKQLPMLLYQIQNKFRDEIRPRSGIIRSREFIMKDAYSFHNDKISLQKMYSTIHDTYRKIFKTLKLQYRSVEADSSSMGGNISHEFQAISKHGEDTIVCSTLSNYAANIDVSPAIEQNNQLINQNIYQESINTTKYTLKPCLKTIIQIILIKSNNYIQDKSLVTLIIKGDHTINLNKVKNISIILKPIEYALKNDVESFVKKAKQSVKNIFKENTIITDISVINTLNLINWIQINNHLIPINNIWKNILQKSTILDIRNTIHGDISPDHSGILEVKNSIEIGHIFQLETKYSNLMNANIQQKDGKKKNIYMGCYGIGISRIIAASIEQNHDHKGIIWPNILAPFKIVIIPINLNKSYLVQNIAKEIYNNFIKEKIDIIFDDRNEQTGIMFAEMNLIGIPHQLIIRENNLINNQIEYHKRGTSKNILISLHEVIEFMKIKLCI
ncbi:Proline--tRNA ligase [Buchnera aphidicola (Eriosoma lanigerum)]|uniref:proline--tRNA ligase n=1 Tax=Buchnera aphidicola TaxID=9 RepID=UPI003464C6A3